MPMNSFSARRGRKSSDEQTDSGVETTEKPDQGPDHEITEITVRVRSAAAAPTSGTDFDMNQLRSQDAEAVSVESLVKGYVDSESKGRRVFPRYSKKMTTVIYTAKQSFRTTTVDISAGGALLADPLPRDFQYGQIEVLLIHEDSATAQKQYLMFKAEAVKNTGPTSRIQFLSTSSTAQQALAQILAQLDPKLRVA